MKNKSQSEILKEVLLELQEIKRGLPNGEIVLGVKSERYKKGYSTQTMD
jgi:hypothetical protein